MAARMGRGTGSWGRSRSSMIGSSAVVLEGGLRFGSTLALPASQDFDGAAEVGWRSFNVVTLLWIDVELTGATSSWLGYGGVGMAVRIGVGSLLALCSWRLFGCGGGSGGLVWSPCDLVMAATGGVTKILMQVLWFRPVIGRSRNAFSGDSDPMMASRPDLSFFILFQFQLCIFDYGYCLRFIIHGWILCSVAIDKLVWVLADGGDPVVVLLLVCGSGSAGRRGFAFPRLSVLLFASCFFYYYFVIVLICSCFLFPASMAYPRGFKLFSFCSGYCTLCALSAIVRCHVIIKWLLPPSVKMKSMIVNLFFGGDNPVLGRRRVIANWTLPPSGRMRHRVAGIKYRRSHLHEEIELLTSILCLCGGGFSSIDRCYLKTNRVAICALVVFRASGNTCMVTSGLRSLSIIEGVLLYVCCNHTRG